MSDPIRALGLSFYVGVTLALSGCGDEPPSSDPPAELSAELRADLQAALDEAVSQGAIPGTALHVVADGETWAGAAGIADIDGAVPMAPEARFRAGSMIKPLVATAVLQNVEEGALALGDSLVDHLGPEVTARIGHADAIDIGMLLGHRSGIPDWVTLAVQQTVVTDPAHVWTLDEVLESTEGQPPAFEPGQTFGYSNTNYILLGEILAAVEGRSWREAVRERVLARANMVDTTLPDPGDLECPGCARGYVSMEDGMLDTTRVDPSMAGASGGHALITTTADLDRFLQQLLAGALFDRAETLPAMLAFGPTPDRGGDEVGGHLVGYGFGVMHLDDEVADAVGHLGGTAGYMGFVLHVPATDRYVSGFINLMGDPSAVIQPVVTRLAQP